MQLSAHPAADDSVPEADEDDEAAESRAKDRSAEMMTID